MSSTGAWPSAATSSTQPAAGWSERPSNRSGATPLGHRAHHHRWVRDRTSGMQWRRRITGAIRVCPYRSIDQPLQTGVVGIGHRPLGRAHATGVYPAPGCPSTRRPGRREGRTMASPDDHGVREQPGPRVRLDLRADRPVCGGQTIQSIPATPAFVHSPASHRPSPGHRSWQLVNRMSGSSTRPHHPKYSAED